MTQTLSYHPRRMHTAWLRTSQDRTRSHGSVVMSQETINPCCRVNQPTVRWLPMLPQSDLQTKYQLTPHFLVGHVECGSDGVRLNEHECLADRSTQLWWVGVGHNFSVHAWDHAVMECQSQTKRHESRGQCSNDRFGKGGITYHAACMRGHP